jgi:hypothetical protein
MPHKLFCNGNKPSGIGRTQKAVYPQFLCNPAFSRRQNLSEQIMKRDLPFSAFFNIDLLLFMLPHFSDFVKSAAVFFYRRQFSHKFCLDKRDKKV